MTDLGTVKDNVDSLLKHFPSTRSNDKKLIFQYYVSFHSISTFKELADSSNDVASPESITRCRRKTQAEGNYLASEEVQALRYENEQAFIDFSYREALERIVINPHDCGGCLLDVSIAKEALGM